MVFWELSHQLLSSLVITIILLGWTCPSLEYCIVSTALTFEMAEKGVGLSFLGSGH